MTPAGRLRVENLHRSIATVLDEDVPGDLIETGVWRGGAVILMRAALMAHGVTDRSVWVADSFEGLPPATLSIDRPDDLSGYSELAIGLETVRANFRKYALLTTTVTTTSPPGMPSACCTRSCRREGSSSSTTTAARGLTQRG